MRHGWAWLAPGWQHALRDPLAAAEVETVERWRTRGAPLVIAGFPEATSERLRLGLATRDRQRIGLTIARDAVATLAPPVSLARAAALAPPDWSMQIERIRAAASAAGIHVAVYGSLAWTVISGTSFLHPDSDLDLVLHLDGGTPARTCEIARGLLARAEDRPRLDGEVLLDGLAVAWRELAGSAPTLLAKTACGPRLIARDALAAAVGETRA